MGTNSNIKDVARRAGVSIATVSHVINNTKPVSEATYMQVLKAIEGLNYKPNQSARSLRRKKTNDQGLIIAEDCIKEYSSLISYLIQIIEEVSEKEVHFKILSLTPNRDMNALKGEYEHLFVILNLNKDSVVTDESTITYINLSPERFIFQTNIVNVQAEYLNEVIRSIKGEEYSKVLMSYKTCEIIKRSIDKEVYSKLIIIDDEVSSGFYEMSRIYQVKNPESILIISPNIALGCLKYLIKNEQVIYLNDIEVSMYLFSKSIDTYNLPIKFKNYDIRKLLGKLKE